MKEFHGSRIVGASKDSNTLNTTIRIPGVASFCTAFDRVGLNVGPRTGSHKRTQEDKEWFVVRHFLKAALRERIFLTPLLVQKCNPPEPDFALMSGDGNLLAYVEITEATQPADQREMTEFERSKKSAMLLGDFGGRFSRGAGQPRKAWASDILDAIKRKRDKTIFRRSDAERHLVIYPNSNASKLLNDDNDNDELGAFGYLRETITMDRDTYVSAANGCLVHVLGKRVLGFDVLGNARSIRRETA